jgi:putative ABC transport system permease protein
MKIVYRLVRESFLFAWQALVVNRLRTILSLLGVTIGIFSIIFVLSVVDSLEADMKRSLSFIGSDILFIQKWPMGPEEGATEYEWWKYMRRRQPNLEDMEKLRDRLSGFSAISYASGSSLTVQNGNNFAEGAKLVGITYQYRETIAMNLSGGRYFLPIECDAGKNFAIIGTTLKEQLFGDSEALGRYVQVGGMKVLVIGVIKKEGTSLFGSGFDSAIILPIRFAARLINPDVQDSKIIIKASEGVSARQLRDEVVAVFREVRGVKPHGDNDFTVIESTMISGVVDSIVGVFNVVGIIIGIFSILVGAFSVANIMFVSVRERTGVIGIQKALGAKNYFILLEFLFESVALCVMGGAAGLLVVWAVITVLNMTMDMEFIMPVIRIVEGIGISAAVGIISGLTPALSAARLNPVDAMRAK